MLGVTKVRFRTGGGSLMRKHLREPSGLFFCGEEGMGEEGEEKSFDGPERPRPEGGGRVGRVRRGMSRGFSTKSNPLKAESNCGGRASGLFFFWLPHPGEGVVGKKVRAWGG